MPWGHPNRMFQEPSKEARASPEAAEWTTAAEREIVSPKERKVYKLVPRTVVPPGRKRIKPKWVFKRKADGSSKGRLVAQGGNLSLIHI